MSKVDLHIPELGNKFTDYRDGVWGNSYSWAWERRTDEIRYVVIHHSVTNPTDDSKANVDYIAEIHKKNGWGGIGYHFVITKDGMVWYVGDVSTARANVANMNEKIIGICLVGDFTKYLPSDEQIISAHKLSNFFLAQANWPNLKDWDDVVGHKDLAATACPGSSWDKKQSGDMWWRIKTGTPYTPPPKDDVEEEANDDGQKTAIDAYKQFLEDLNGVLRIPIGTDDFATILAEVQKIKTKATNLQEDLKIKEREELEFVKEVAKGIGSASETKTAVLEVLRDLEKHIDYIETKRLEEFSAVERIISGIKALFRKSEEKAS